MAAGDPVGVQISSRGGRNDLLLRGSCARQPVAAAAGLLPCSRGEQEEVRPVGRGASGLAARAGAEGAVIRARPRPVIVPSLVSPRGHVVVPRVGLRFPARLPFEAWVAVGRQLSAVATSSAWCIGDWLAYGQD